MVPCRALLPQPPPPRAGMEDMISSWHPSNLRAEGGTRKRARTHAGGGGGGGGRGGGPKKGGPARGGGGGKQEEEESPEDRFFGTEPKRAHFHDYPEKGRGGSVFHDYRAVGGNRRRDPPKKTTVTCSCWYIIQCSTHYLCVLPMFRSSTSTCDRANITTS